MKAAANDPVQQKLIEDATPDVLNAKGLLMFLKRSPDEEKELAEAIAAAEAAKISLSRVAAEEDQAPAHGSDAVMSVKCEHSAYNAR